MDAPIDNQIPPMIDSQPPQPELPQAPQSKSRSGISQWFAHLPTAQKRSVAGLALIAMVIPVSVAANQVAVRMFPKAYEPITPPLTPPMSAPKIPTPEDVFCQTDTDCPSGLQCIVVPVSDTLVKKVCHRPIAVAASPTPLPKTSPQPGCSTTICQPVNGKSSCTAFAIPCPTPKPVIEPRRCTVTECNLIRGKQVCSVRDAACPTPTPIPVMSCNLSVRPPKTCPVGYQCVTSSPKAGSAGTCKQILLPPTPTPTQIPRPVPTPAPIFRVTEPGTWMPFINQYFPRNK